MVVNSIIQLTDASREMEKGKLDVAIKIKSKDELGELASSFNSMAAQIKEHQEHLEDKIEKRTKQLKEAMDELWGEMELAKKIQTILLPENPKIPDYDVLAYMEPADEVGGDYYDVVTINDISWLVIGDVSGHGVPAGLMMMMAQSMINLIIKEFPNEPPSVILSKVNHQLTKNAKKLGGDKYMTMTILAAFEKNKFYFSGLHQDLIIYRKATKSIETIETSGMWIGMMDEIAEYMEDSHFTMSSGDILFLYTDGIIEASYKEQQYAEKGDMVMFGEKKIMDILIKNAERPLPEIQQEILYKLDDYITEDDVTMMMIRKT